jgi:8-oxo-dGTP pyrophosphatase MutT (NUDIX family)
MWQVQASRPVLDNRWYTVVCDTCILPGGRVIDDYYYQKGGDFAQVVALNASGDVILTRQYKHAVRQIVIELPGGMLSTPDEEPSETARRELREETGAIADRLIPLGVLNVASAKSTARAHAFLARDVRLEQQPVVDDQEIIETLTAPIEQVRAWIRDGKIRDAHSIAAIYLADLNDTFDRAAAQ